MLIATYLVRATVIRTRPIARYTPPDAPLSRFKELQSILGLERAVLVNASCHGVDNTVIVDAIAQSGGKYRGVANADDSFTERDFEKLHEQGFRGVRFNFVKHLGGMPDMDEFHRILARIKPLGWHIDLHFDAGDLVEFDDFLHKLPVPFIIDHMGRVPTKAGLDQPPFRALLNLARKHPTLLGQSLRCGAHLERRAAVHGCRAVRAGADRGHSGPDPVGHGLAAPEHFQAHAERRRPGGSHSADRAGSGNPA